MINLLFGNFLVKTGALTAEQLNRALETQKKVRVRLGLIAVTEKLMSPEQSEEVNRLQAVMDKRFGDIAIEKGYLSEEQVERLLGLQGKQYLTFAQAVTDNGFMTLKEFENAFNAYQRELGFTSTDMEALKSGDSDRIVPLFLPYGCEPKQVEHILVAIRTLLRLIDSDAYIGKASWENSIPAEGIAYQSITGEIRASLGIVGDVGAVLNLAGTFGKEEFEKLDQDSLDSVAEFINCINGLFATKISSELSVDMLPPFYNADSVTVKSERILKLPVYLNGRELNILSVFNGEIDV